MVSFTGDPDALHRRPFHVVRRDGYITGLLGWVLRAVSLLQYFRSPVPGVRVHCADGRHEHGSQVLEYVRACSGWQETR